ncbi:HPP family protein [Thalassolituus sp.]|jgi:CBS domain-containing protein|uniref:CBS domain-containing protein n=1 Tax=Thalassolituus sp. TaxID=2030822 RepID=UPI002A7FCC31|nr:CBS domain-containing protein [Thalassolituus sp.]|tara:strand:- start:3755 stop:4177 length:423 start_codon:yes stop_codon:yes gene_type:complete
MKTISDIMITELFTLTPQCTLLDAERLMREHQVRHIPIIDNNRRLVGLLSQKEFLREAFRITDKFGAHHLQDYFSRTEIGSCISADITTVAPGVSLKAAGETLRREKQGCLLVADADDKLIGIVTSQDFVRLAIRLLESD